MEKKTAVLLLVQEFFRAGSLDSVMVKLERDDYGEEGGTPEYYYSGGIFLSEQGQGHFCFEDGDLAEIAEAAGLVMRLAGRLHDACLSAAAGAPIASTEDSATTQGGPSDP